MRLQELPALVRQLGARRLVPPPPPPQETLPRLRRTVEGLRHSRRRDPGFDRQALRRLQRLLRARARPVDGLHLRGVPQGGHRPGRRPGGEVRPGRPQARRCGRGCGCSTSAAAGAAWRCTLPSGTASRRRRHPVPRSRRTGPGPRWSATGSTTGCRSSTATTATRRAATTTRSPPSACSSTSGSATTAPTSRCCGTSCASVAGCSTTASPGPTTARRPLAGHFIDRYVFPDGELTGSGRIITEAQDAGLEVRHEENLREHYALTLRGWCANLVANWDACVAEVGDDDGPGVGAVHGRLAARLRDQPDPAAPGARGPGGGGRRRVVPAAPGLVSARRGPRLRNSCACPAFS